MAKKVIYLVDYAKDGIDRHCMYEMLRTGIKDSDIVNMLHFMVGKNSRLDGVVEFQTDMMLKEFEQIYETEEIKKIPFRVLHMNMDTVNMIRKAEGLPTV